MTPNQSEELLDVTSGKPEETSSGVMNDPHTRPPKPEPFGGRDRSEQSRDELRVELRKRRTSLTRQEHGFLEQLVVHGNEIEVELAKEKLLDEDLFFEDGDRATSPPPTLAEASRGWGSEIDIGSESSLSSIPDFSGDFRSGSLSSSTGAFHLSISSGIPLLGRRGSEKHQEHLEARRKEAGWERLWKAHATGLALTKMGSQRNLIQKKRRASLSGPALMSRAELVRRSSVLSNSTKDLLLEGGPIDRPGEDDIFRGEGINALKLDTVAFPDIPKGPNMNGRSVSLTKLATLKRPPRSRLKSEGSRKSVTFKADHELHEINDIPGRVVEAGYRRPSDASDISELSVKDPFSSTSTMSSTALLETIPSTSMSSIPSLRHAHPVRSNSISSIPSLHHGHPIRGDSLSSIPSLHHAHHVHSESNMSLPSQTSPRSQSISSFQSDTKEVQSNAAWTSPLPSKEGEQRQQLLRHPDQEPRRAMLFRQASRSFDNGQGIEVSEVDSLSSDHQVDTLSDARRFSSMISMGDSTNGGLSASSFDETSNRRSVFREIRATLSDENLSSIFLGTSKALIEDSVRSTDLREDEERDDSWDMDGSDDEGQYDAWDVLKNENNIDYGSSIPFLILGTSGDDAAATPHVLSPPLLESLQNFLPYSVSEDNFWMKYSLLRDGASLYTMLQQIRGARHTIIALETWDGEVFGSFTSASWRKNWNYFGTGEAFLWRMRQSRKTVCSSIIDQAHMESELDVYPWTGDNECVQLCTSEMIAVGGGDVDRMKGNVEGGDEKNAPEYGFGLTIDNELLYGTSTDCATFGSPPLSLEHSDGSRFEIVNLEVWTMTPCMRLEEAEKLELGKLFLESK